MRLLLLGVRAIGNDLFGNQLDQNGTSSAGSWPPEYVLRDIVH